MADPQTARLTQLRNIQTKTGKTIAELHAVLVASGLAKTGERRSLLMERFKLGYGDANAVAFLVGKALPVLDGVVPSTTSGVAGDPLDTIYSGTKAHLRPLHEAVIACVRAASAALKRPQSSPTSACAAAGSLRCWGRQPETPSKSGSITRP